MAESGAKDLANILLPALIAGKSFTVPDVDLSGPIYQQPDQTGIIYDPVEKITVADLTTGEINGPGVFDQIMKSLVAHLKVEYNAGRISGAEYTKAYIGLVQTALGTAAQFVLGQDAAYWQALLVQQQAQLAEIEKVKGRIELETARVMLTRMKYEAAASEINYALTKMKLSTEDATYGNLVKQGDVIVAQKTGVDHENTGKAYTNTWILPLQKALLGEQVEVQRAQTLDNRTDGALITGAVGKQKELYSRQIKSYADDAATKVAKFYNDSWITQKTIDEGTTPPADFTAAKINEVMVNLKNMVGLD